MYHGGDPVVVRGPVTGFTYLFGPTGQLLLVDARDVEALVGSGRFEIPRHSADQHDLR